MISFTDEAFEVFAQLSPKIQSQAVRNLDLARVFPRFRKVREHGLMAGYRFFVVEDLLFFYRHGGDDVQLVAILPGRMEEA